MFFLPRICEHCLNPSCVASCPSGAMYKRAEDGIVLVDQDQCRGWRMCVTGCPYKKVYFNHRTGKAEKCTFCYPRIEVGLPTVCSETCVGRLRYIGLFLYDADRVTAAASVADEHDLYEAQLDLLLDPHDPAVIDQRPPRRHRRGLDRRRPAARRSTGWPRTTGWRCRCTRSSARCRWSGTSRRCPRWSTGSPRPATTARTPATCSAPSTRCASRSSTSPSCSPRATRNRSRGVLQKLAAMRSYMRDVTLGPSRATSRSPPPSGMTGGEIVEMYRLLAIAKYEERYVIPTAYEPSEAHQLEELACSLDVDGGPGMLGSGPFGEAFRHADAGVGGDLPRAAGPADQRPTSPTPATVAPGSTCSTGTARAARRAVPAATRRRGPGDSPDAARAPSSADPARRRAMTRTTRPSSCRRRRSACSTPTTPCWRGCPLVRARGRRAAGEEPRANG